MSWLALLGWCVSQETVEARTRIQQIVADHYLHHESKERLVANYYALWERLPNASLRSQALVQIDVNSRGVQDPLVGIDYYRQRIGEHPVYERMILPESYYRRLYVVAERMITRELATAATFRGHDAVTRKALSNQIDALCDHAQAILEARVMGVGGSALIKELLDEQRRDYKAAIDNPWEPLQRIMTDAEVLDLRAHLEGLARECPVVMIEQYKSGSRLQAATRRLATGDAYWKDVETAQSAIRRCLSKLSRITDTLNPALMADMAERRIVIDEAASAIAQAKERERLVLQEIQKQAALRDASPGARALRNMKTRQSAASSPESERAAKCLPEEKLTKKPRGGLVLLLVGSLLLVTGTLFAFRRASH